MFARLNEAEAPLVRRVAALEDRPVLWRLMLAATRAADGWALAVIVPVSMLVGGWRGLGGVTCGAISGLTTAAVIQALKAVLRRERPPGIELARPITAPDRHAFPSGHTAHTCSVMVVAFWISPWMGLAMVPVVLAVGMSRVFFGLHYPSDVLVGAAIGCAVAWQVLRVAERIGLVNAIVAYGNPP